MSDCSLKAVRIRPENNPLIDIELKEFFSEKQALEMLEKASENDVKKTICIGTSHEDSLAAREFASKHDNVYWTYGVHPESAGVADNVFFKDICRFSSSETYIPDGAEKAARRADFPGRPAYDVEDEKVRPEKDMSDRTPAKHYAILCPHYEGYDERIMSIVDYPISLGKYVLTGGELPALIIIDSVVRLIPGVLGGESSAEIESFSDGDNLEYPQYTRPEDFRGMKVPEVLLSGHHGNIAKWREAHTGKLGQDQ